MFFQGGTCMSNEADKNKSINCLDDYFSKIDLYVDLEFKLYEKIDEESYSFNSDEFKRLCNILNIEKKSIDEFCVFCGKEYPFDVTIYCSESAYLKNLGGVRHEILSLGENIYIDINKSDYSELPVTVDAQELYKFKTAYIVYELNCKKHPNHVYRMYTVLFIFNGCVTLRKIGQFPSKIDIWGFDFDQYKNQLDKFNAYADFKKAELSMSDKLFAGAYTYLRRVFEKMLNNYCSGIDLPDRRIETRIESCKEKFDERVRPLLKNLYGILSVGIHELDDEQSERYYVHLRTVIELQLEYTKEINDKEEQTKRLKGNIDSIANEVKR